MRMYGQVKGRRHGADQPLPRTVRKGTKVCPKCRRRLKDACFVGGDGLPRKTCWRCREEAAAKKRKDNG